MSANRRPIQPKPSSFVNPTTGETVVRRPAPGGSIHTYGDGRSQFVGSTQPGVLGSGLRIPATPKPAPAATPATPATPSAASAAAAQPYRDSTYFAQSAQDTFDRANQDQSLVDQSAADTTNYREALRRYREQQPKQLRQNLESANAQGLAQSTAHSEADADTVINNQRGEQDMTDTYTGREAARVAARNALASGASIQDATRLAEAADRQTTANTTDADNNSLAINPTVGAPAATSTPARATPAAAAISPKASSSAVARSKAAQATARRQELAAQKAALRVRRSR